MARTSGAKRGAAALTELESCVLGVIWRHEPCSAYAVRRVFAVSHATAWSASAGSIYPVIRKLEKLGLVRMKALASDARGRSNLSLTAKGAAAMRRWISRLEAWSAAPMADPIRTRLFFLDALDRRRQLAFLDRAEALTRAALAATRAFVESQRRKSKMDHLASLGAAYGLESRLNWLQTARRTLAKGRRHTG